MGLGLGMEEKREFVLFLGILFSAWRAAENIMEDGNLSALALLFPKENAIPLSDR